MSRRIAPPHRMRRRLTVAFVLVAGLSSGVLAVGSFVLVRQSRLEDSLDRATATAREALTRTPLPPATLLDTYSGESYETLIVTPSGTVPSRLTLELEDVPPALEALVEAGRIGFQRTTVALGPGAPGPVLVIGGPARAPDTDVYLFFSEGPLHDDLRQLAVILALGWAAVTLLAGLVGRTVARRTLEPVARASQAARALSEGLLTTRLPSETEDEFGAWAASFNDMAEALESKIAALTEAQARERRFTSDVAHELRTPLTAIVSEASLLKEHLDQMPPEARRPAELLVADVARLRRLVEDLMEISRLDAGRASVRAEEIDLSSLVKATVRSRGWESRVRVDAEPAVIATDRRRLERIVANLIGNALEHGGRDVTVRAGRDGTGAFVEVSDRGRGIAPDHMTHLFDRFYKADPARTGPGSGLGLAIALENARLLGGDLEVWSEMGEGTRFTLRLPVAAPLPRGESVVAAPAHDEANP